MPVIFQSQVLEVFVGKMNLPLPFDRDQYQYSYLIRDAIDEFKHSFKNLNYSELDVVNCWRDVLVKRYYELPNSNKPYMKTPAVKRILRATKGKLMYKIGQPMGALSS